MNESGEIGGLPGEFLVSLIKRFKWKHKDNFISI